MTAVNVEAFCWFQSYISVTAQATMEFEAGQPVDTDVVFLTTDPWISMYPG